MVLSDVHLEHSPPSECSVDAAAAAIRAVERVLLNHGYPDPERSLEILHVAVGYSDDDYPTRLN